MLTMGNTFAFKLDLLGFLPGDNIKIALYSPGCTLDLQTTTYTAAGEVSGPGSTAGGKSMSILPGYPQIDAAGRAVARFGDVTWPGAVFTARAALIYNASKANRALMVIDFGAPRRNASGAFVFKMPLSQDPIIVLG